MGAYFFRGGGGDDHLPTEEKTGQQHNFPCLWAVLP